MNTPDFVRLLAYAHSLILKVEDMDSFDYGLESYGSYFCLLKLGSA